MKITGELALSDAELSSTNDRYRDTVSVRHFEWIEHSWRARTQEMDGNYLGTELGGAAAGVGGAAADALAALVAARAASVAAEAA
jgi:hypothetical protein